MGTPRGDRLAGEAPRWSGMLNRLSQVLLECASDQVTGTIRVAGEPGGTVYLASGAVTAIDTPGAPGPEVVMLRSGRVPEAGWMTALAASADSGDLGGELIKRDLIGAGELEALQRLALADAMFVLAAGELAEYVVDKAAVDCTLPLEPGAGSAWLLAETTRRLGVLASLASPVEHDRDRWTAARGAGPSGLAAAAGSGSGTDAILALANGRRTARDIAFVLGRGVYAITLQLARMYADGLLLPGARRVVPAQPSDPARRTASQQAGPATDGTAAAGSRAAGTAAGRATARGAVTRRTAAAGSNGAASDGAAGDAGAAEGAEQASALPRRRRGTPGQPRRPRATSNQVDRAALLRLLRPGGTGADESPGDTV